jgi:glutaredoxin 3
MNRVRMFTKRQCGYSLRARLFLEERGIPYDDIDITDDAARRAEMEEAAGGETTTPQIFVGGEHIGGYEDLVEEERAGRLAAMLASGVGEARV